MGDGSDTPGYFGWELCLKSSLSPSISPCSIQCQWELLPRNLKRAQQRLPLLGNNVRPFFRRLLRQQLYFTQLAAPGEEMECSQQSWATSWAGGERAGLPHWGFWGAEIVLCAHLEQKDEATGDDFSAVAHLLLGRPVLSPKPSRSCVCVYSCTLPERAAKTSSTSGNVLCALCSSRGIHQVPLGRCQPFPWAREQLVLNVSAMGSKASRSRCAHGHCWLTPWHGQDSFLCPRMGGCQTPVLCTEGRKVVLIRMASPLDAQVKPPVPLL